MIRPELFFALVALLFGGTGLILFVYGLYSLFIKGFDKTKRLNLLAIGGAFTIIVLFFILRNPGQKFVGTYVAWDNKAVAIKLKSDGTFEANFEIEGTKRGHWEFINIDEFYFIELKNANDFQIERLGIFDREEPIKLRLVPRDSWRKNIELVKL